MTDPTLWNQLLIWPIINLLIVFYKLSEALYLPGPLGFAIIFMTLAMRLLLYPLTQAQMKSARQMAKLKPHLDELKAKHKDDKAALQQAQLALYKEQGINPASGCLPLLVQLPILFALSGVFNSVFAGGDISKMVTEINAILYSPALQIQSLDLKFLGFDLATKPSAWQTQGWWLLAVPVVTALISWWQTKMMMPDNKSKALEDKSKEITVKNKDKNASKDGKKEEKKEEDMAAEMQKQMAIMSPLMLGIFAYQFSVGLALYWNMFSIFGMIQQRFINKKYG